MRVSDLYCQSCLNAKDHKPRDDEVCWSCMAICGAGNYKESKTNADRIRAMTDEELAKKMSGLESFALTCGGAWPPEKWLQWLRQEANI